MPSLTTWKELSSFSTGRETQIELSSLAGLRRQSSELGEAKATRSYRTEYRRGGATQKAGDPEICRGDTWQLWVMTCHMWKKLPRQKKKNDQEGVSEKITTVNIGSEIVHVLGTQTKKTSLFTRHGARRVWMSNGTASERYCFNREAKLAIEKRLFLITLTKFKNQTDSKEFNFIPPTHKKILIQNIQHPTM